MNRQKRPIRLLFFSFLLVCLLAGLAGISRLPTQVQAAPQFQATSCLGTTITQWTFTGDVITPSTGYGTFSAGTGLPATAFAAGVSGGTDRAVSYNGWPLAFDASFYVDLLVPTLGRNSINLAFDYRSTGTGPTTLELHYSTDGTNFTPLGSPSALINDSTFRPLSYNLSAITGLDDNSSATFRLYGYGATGAGGTLRLDNITLIGNCLIPADTATPTPSATAAPPLSLLINEVAWAGTLASSSDEWFELYNPGATNINLNGWSLTADDGNPSIPLSGTILAGDYFVVARYSAVFSDLTVDLTYSSGTFDNAGEILYLLDPNGNQVDRANSDGGAWPAGLASTYATMERLGVIADGPTAWATYGGTTPVAHDRATPTPNPIKGTPGQGNWITTVTVTPSPTTTATRTPTVSRTPTKTRTPTKPRTPTRRPTAAPQPLVAINEALPRPGHDWNHDGKINTGDEYIELINHGVIDVNLNGYRLDDEANIGSTPYSIPSITIKPGERIVFYGGVTGLLLSDGGDGVRLLRPNGQLMDAFNYSVVFHPDQAYCRLPDNGGADDWAEDCFPTPGLRNALGSSVAIPDGTVEESLCPISDSLPMDFVLAECPPFGNDIWRPAYWDDPGWLGDEILPETNSKWSVYVD